MNYPPDNPAGIPWERAARIYCTERDEALAENARLRKALTELTALVGEMPDDIETIHSEFCSLDMDRCARRCGERLKRVVAAVGSSGVPKEPTETELTGQNLRDSGMREPGSVADGAQ